MKLYLVQHGIPVPKELNPDKPLSEQGRQDIERLATFLREAGIVLASVFHSGKTRARQTADILARSVLMNTETEQLEGLSPLDDIHATANFVNETTSDIMLVGHLPHLNKLVSFLITGNEDKKIVSFQQGGLVRLEKSESNSWYVTAVLLPELLSGERR